MQIQVQMQINIKISIFEYEAFFSLIPSLMQFLVFSLFSLFLCFCPAADICVLKSAIIAIVSFMQSTLITSSDHYESIKGFVSIFVALVKIDI